MIRGERPGSFIVARLGSVSARPAQPAPSALPSAGNLQGYEIFRVTREKERAALARAALEQFFVAQAPVVLVFCANRARSAVQYRERGARLYAIPDATIACAFAMLAATALGLGTVWVGAFDDAAVQRVLGRHDLLPVAILPVGYPAEEPEPTRRRSLADLVHEIVRPDRPAGETGVSRMSGMPR